jgi:phospholipase D1/2
MDHHAYTVHYSTTPDQLNKMTTPVADAALKHPDPTSKTLSKLSSKFDRLTTNMSRLGTAVKTTLNPNHRHDEEWEQEVDAKIEKIRDGHRFRSFAGERDGKSMSIDTS